MRKRHKVIKIDYEAKYKLNRVTVNKGFKKIYSFVELKWMKDGGKVTKKLKDKVVKKNTGNEGWVKRYCEKKIIKSRYCFVRSIKLMEDNDKKKSLQDRTVKNR